MQQRPRDDFALAEFASERQRLLELGSGALHVVLGEQGAADLQMFQALMRAIVQRRVDRQRFARGGLRVGRFAGIVEEACVRADHGRVGRGRAALRRGIERTLEIRARGRRILDFAIQQRDVAIGVVELVAAVFAQGDGLQAAFQRAGEVAAIAIDHAEIAENECCAGRVTGLALQAERTFRVTQRFIEMTAPARDDPEHAFGDRFAEAIAMLARQLEQAVGQNDAAFVGAKAEGGLRRAGEN